MHFSVNNAYGRKPLLFHLDQYLKTFIDSKPIGGGLIILPTTIIFYMAQLKKQMKHYISFFLALLILLPLYATASVYAAAQTLPGLSVSGIQIVANGRPVRLRGINMGDPFWARNPDWYPAYSLADYGKLAQ